jgi:hypothetical protein
MTGEVYDWRTVFDGGVFESFYGIERLYLLLLQAIICNASEQLPQDGSILAVSLLAEVFRKRWRLFEIAEASHLACYLLSLEKSL